MSIEVSSKDSTNPLQLTRVGRNQPAGLWIASLPTSRILTSSLSLEGANTTAIPLGCWPGKDAPRRFLLIADGENTAPKQLLLSSQVEAATTVPPSAKLKLVDQATDERMAWETHALQIEHEGRCIEIMLGLRREDGVHWWENCGLTTRQEGPHCLSLEAGGVIPVIREEFDEMMANPGYKNPLLHKHNWLNGHIYARLHSNGVCEVYIRHINSKFVDAGGDLPDVVPVIGFRTAGSTEELDALSGPWDGTVTEFASGDVRFDVSEPARLVSPEQPGNFAVQDGQLVWQPYLGVEIYGGVCPQTLYGDPFVFRPEQKIFPQGMTRTLRFSFSLSDRSPRVVRYLAPAWWHGVCEDFLPEPLLPVSNEYDADLEEGRKWIREHTFVGGFEDGAVARHSLAPKNIEGKIRNEAGWEGDTPYSQFLSAWRTGDGEEYLAALRSAYHYCDIAIDHSSKIARMHGFPNSKASVPGTRMQGTVVAYLETGDPFLRQAAEAVVSNAYWAHKNSWPRMCVGRDACYLRAAVLLYRYCGDEFFRKIALDGALDTIYSQRPDGSFGDQGGGARLHGWNAYFIKPWMGLLALNGTLDYLELCPGEPTLHAGVIRFADWLMAERLPRGENGILSWAYQHDFNGRRRQHDFYTDRWINLPDSSAWHHETLGRLLLYATLTTGNAAYFEAWDESRQLEHPLKIDHAATAVLQFIPWVQAKLWNARLGKNGVDLRPCSFSTKIPAVARIMTPDGPLSVTRLPGGKVRVELAPKAASESVTSDSIDSLSPEFTPNIRRAVGATVT